MSDPQSEFNPDLAIHREVGAFWDDIADWYGERDEAQSIEFLRAGGNYLFDKEKPLLGDLSP